MKPTKGKVDVKKLKAQLSLSDYEKIFKALSLPIFSKGHKYWTLYTGCHNADPYKGSPKLLYYFNTGIFQCLTGCACSFDIISLVQKRLTLLKQPSSFLEAIDFIMSVTGLQIDDVQRLTKPNVYDWEQDLGRFLRFRHTGSTLPTYDKSILQDLSPSIPQQWLDEGISQETMAKYCIGYYERTGATTIPCFNQQGDLIGIRCRHWEPNEIQLGKYRPLTLLDGTTFKFQTNAVFYGINYNWNEIETNKTAILVESEKAVMWLDSVYGEKNIALGMYGKNLGLQRRNHLIRMGVNKIIYVPDNDWIGRDKQSFDNWEQEVIKFGEQFKGYANVEVIWDNLGLLKSKENATDNGVETWKKLLESKETLL